MLFVKLRDFMILFISDCVTAVKKKRVRRIKFCFEKPVLYVKRRTLNFGICLLKAGKYKYSFER